MKSMLKLIESRGTDWILKQLAKSHLALALVHLNYLEDYMKMKYLYTNSVEWCMEKGIERIL